MRKFSFILVLVVAALFSSCNIFVPVDENSDFNWEQDSLKIVKWDNNNVKLKLIGANIPKRVKITTEPTGVVDVVKNDDNSVTVKYVSGGKLGRECKIIASYGDKRYECNVISFEYIMLDGIKIRVNGIDFLMPSNELLENYTREKRRLNIPLSISQDSISVEFLECVPNNATFQYVHKIDAWGSNNQDRGMFNDVLKGKRAVIMRSALAGLNVVLYFAKNTLNADAILNPDTFFCVVEIKSVEGQ